jgi:hypothetical protein
MRPSRALCAEKFWEIFVDKNLDAVTLVERGKIKFANPKKEI